MKKSDGSVWIFILLVVLIGCSVYSHWPKSNKTKVNDDIAQLQNELENIQSDINALDSFARSVSPENFWVYDVGDDFFDAVYYVIDDSIDEKERAEAVEYLRSIVSGSREDYIYSFDSKDIPIIGEDATSNAYDLTEKIYYELNP